MSGRIPDAVELPAPTWRFTTLLGRRAAITQLEDTWAIVFAGRSCTGRSFDQVLRRALSEAQPRS